MYAIRLIRGVILKDVHDFIKQERTYEKKLGKLMGWDYISDQKKGSCWDYETKNGLRIEAKFDWDSIKTGNHYLEISQTSNGGASWEPSGYSLSSKKADYWIVVNDDWLRLFDMPSLQKFVETNRPHLKIKGTKSGVNYNRPGQGSKALVIPFSMLDDICLIKTPSPIQRKK
jgi:hypothetical protein